MNYIPLPWEARQSGKEWRLVRSTKPKKSARTGAPTDRIVARVTKDFDGKWHVRIEAVNGFNGDISGPYDRLEAAMKFAYERVTTTKRLAALFKELE